MVEIREKYFTTFHWPTPEYRHSFNWLYEAWHLYTNASIHQNKPML